MLFLQQTDDVLSLILDFCSKPSLLSLFTTSSELHSLVAPNILRDVHLTRDHAQITSFLEYITTTHRRRVPFVGDYVKSLDIAYSAIVPVIAMEDGEEEEIIPQSPTWANLLPAALSHMPNLRALTLGCQVDKILASYPAIADRIQDLKNLSSIQLSDIDTPAANLLCTGNSASSSSLRKIKIVLKRHMKLVPVSSETGIGKMMIQNRHTLSEVFIANADLSATNFLESPSAVFPNVTTLSLTSYNASPADLSRAFPNVRVLTLTGCSSSLSSPTTPNLPQDQTEEGTLFPHVTSLHTDEPDLRTLLSSPFTPTPTPSLSLSNLHHLSLNSISLSKYSSSWFLKGANLSGLKSFRFSIWNATPPSESWWTEFAQCVPNLEFLNATIRVYSNFEDALMINNNAEILSSLPLKYISLRTLRSDAKSPPLRDEHIARKYEAFIKTLQGMSIFGWESEVEASFWIKNSMPRGVSRMSREEGREMREHMEQCL